MSANYLTLHCLQERRQFGTTLFAFALSQEKFVRMAVSVTVIHMSHVSLYSIFARLCRGCSCSARFVAV